MYGVIDIGSNTIRLSIYKMTEDGFYLMLNKKNMAGLAGYIDKNGKLNQKGITKLVNVLQGFKYTLDNIEVKDVFLFGTASLRNIVNTDEALEKIFNITGYNVEILTGVEEAKLDFVGATHFLKLDKGILVDIGGGSTEIVSYENGEIKKAFSMPFGSLNLYTKYVKDILPNEKEFIKMKNKISEEVEKINLKSENQIICGVGGSIRCACKLNQEIYDLSRDYLTIDINNFNEMIEKFKNNRKFLIKKILKIAPDRIHTILPGLIILQCLSEKFQCQEIFVSQYAVREGYLCDKLYGENKQNEQNR